MTLKNDEAVVDDTVVRVSFHDIPCHRVAIDFEKEKWHFYFSQEDDHLVGFAFNKNFEVKAEEIRTEGLIDIDAMKLCKMRSWWITTDSLAPVYSGKDEINASAPWLE